MKESVTEITVEDVNGRCRLIRSAHIFFSCSFFEIFSILSIHYCSYKPNVVKPFTKHISCNFSLVLFYFVQYMT